MDSERKTGIFEVPVSIRKLSTVEQAEWLLKKSVAENLSTIIGWNMYAREVIERLVRYVHVLEEAARRQ
jgi:hypothetical protein